MDVTVSAAERILAYGVLGPLVVVLGIVVSMLWRRNNALTDVHKAELVDAYKARHADAQLVTEKLVQAATAHATTLVNATNAMDATKHSMADLKDAMRDIADELRKKTR